MFVDYLTFWRAHFPPDTPVYPLPGYTKQTFRYNAKKFAPVPNCTAEEESSSPCYPINGTLPAWEPLKIKLMNPLDLGVYMTDTLADNFIIPFAEYAPYETFLFLISATHMTWDITMKYLSFGQLRRGALAEIGDFIQQPDVYALEMLCQGQLELDGYHSSITLPGVLFTFLDKWSTIASNVATIICVLQCIAYIWQLPEKKKKRKTHQKNTNSGARSRWAQILQRGFQLIDSVCLYLAVWISLFCKQGAAFVDIFTEPLLKSRTRRPSNWIVIWLSATALGWGALHSEYFTNELISHLMEPRLVYLNNASDFLANQPQYDLKFGSFHKSLNESLADRSIPKNFDSALTQIAQLYEAYVTYGIKGILERLVLRNWVFNAGESGAEWIMMRDEMWHRKRYHIMDQKTPPMRGGIVLHSDFVKSFPAQSESVKIHLLKIEESGLMRRYSRRERDIYHERQMKAYLYESHADDVADLALGDIFNIFCGIAYLLAAIVIKDVLWRIFIRITNALIVRH